MNNDKSCGQVTEHAPVNEQPVESRMLSIDDGLQAHVLCRKAQRQSGKLPCLMLHGFTNNAHIWDPLADKLSTDHDVYAIDFRGHGDSSWDPEKRYTHEVLVQDLSKMLRQLDLGRFHLIAHSLGARVAALYAHQFEPELGRCILVDTGPEVGKTAALRIRDDVQSTPQVFGTVEDYTDYLGNIYLFSDRQSLQRVAQHSLKHCERVGLVPKTDPEFLKALYYPKHVDTSDSSGLKAPINEQLWQAMAAITVPTLLVRGRASAILSRKVANRLIEETMPCARLVEISGAGHAVMTDNPQAFEEVVLSFMNEEAP